MDEYNKRQKTDSGRSSNARYISPYDVAPQDIRNSGYLNHQPYGNDYALMLATKVNADMNALIQYLEATDPFALKTSHLPTAHYLVNLFINSMIQQNKPTSMFSPSPSINPFLSTTMLANIKTTPQVQPNTSPITPTVSYHTTTISTVSTTTSAQSNTTIPPSSPSIKSHLAMFRPVTKTYANTNVDVDFGTVSFDSFEMLDVLGTGTFGKVRLCRHKNSKKHFCMKILNKARIVRLKQTEHIQNEKDVLLKVSHPYIVKLYRTYQDTANIYLLMEFVPGGELFNYIRRAGRLPNNVAKIYTAEIVLAFEHMHKMNIVYRDLKPENLLVDEYGHIKLTDFGFSKQVHGRTFSMCGTPEYIAPEIILSKGHSFAADWWSLGILIFEMLAGYPPFSDEPTKTIFEKILGDKVEIPDYFHPHAKDLIEKLLVSDSASRLGTNYGADELRNHEWFSGIDWQILLEKRVAGPLNPEISRDGDTHNFYKYSDVNINEDKDATVNYEALFADF